jgi:hypothetical protein
MKRKCPYSGKCVDLNKRFGRKYQVDSEGPPINSRPYAHLWNQEIPCQKGVIFPIGGDLLCLELEGYPVTADRIAAMPDTWMSYACYGIRHFAFHVDLFDEIARVVHPKKRKAKIANVCTKDCGDARDQVGLSQIEE